MTRPTIAHLLRTCHLDGGRGTRERTYREALLSVQDDALHELAVHVQLTCDLGDVLDPETSVYRRLVRLGMIEEDDDCPTCGGSGGGPDPETRCWSCRGSGQRVEEP